MKDHLCQGIVCIKVRSWSQFKQARAIRRRENGWISADRHSKTFRSRQPDQFQRIRIARQNGSFVVFTHALPHNRVTHHVMDSNPLWPKPSPTPGTCSDCDWMFHGGRGRPVPRCRRHNNQRISPEWPSCPAFTQNLDCVQCGACCREAYDTVEVSRRDPFRKQYPELLKTIDGRLNIRRKGSYCINLNEHQGCFYLCRIFGPSQNLP